MRPLVVIQALPTNLIDVLRQCNTDVIDFLYIFYQSKSSVLFD